MIFSIVSRDKEKALKKIKSIVDNLVKKRPGVSIFRIDNQNWDEIEFNNLISSQDIFVSKSIIILNDIFLNEEAKYFFIKNIEIIKNSPNVFIISEEKVDKNIISKLKNYSYNFFELFLEKSNEKGKFNIFSLADALGKRNKKEAWLIYLKALESGMSAEEIYSIVWWQFKSMLIAKKSASQEESGLKPFVFKKSLSMSKNFSGNDLERISSKVLDFYHSSRNGKLNLEMAIEKFILEG